MTIELGVVNDTPPEPVPTRRRPATRRPWTVPVLGLLAVVLLLATGAAGPAADGLLPLRTVPAMGRTGYAVAGETLLVSQTDGRGNRITAYRLPGTVRRWSAPISLLASQANLQVIDGVVLASSYEPGVSGDHTVALDLAGGRVLWHSAWTPNGLLSGTDEVLMSRVLPSDAAGGSDGGPGFQTPAELRAVRLRDGTVRWSYRMPAGCQHGAAFAGRTPARGVAVLCLDNELRLLDPASGHVVRSTLLPGNGIETSVRLPDGTTRWDVGPILQVVGQQVLIGYRSGRLFALAAYDVASLRVQWMVRLGGELYGADGCGPALCVSGASGLTVLDRATGAVRWHRDDRVLAQVISDGLGALVAVSAVSGSLPDVQLVSLDDGRTLLDLGDWTVAGPPGLPALFLRWDAQTGRTWFGVLSRQAAALHPLGVSADAIQDACTWSGRYLVCQTVAGGLRLWRYRG